LIPADPLIRDDPTTSNVYAGALQLMPRLPPRKVVQTYPPLALATTITPAAEDATPVHVWLPGEVTVAHVVPPLELAHRNPAAVVNASKFDPFAEDVIPCQPLPGDVLHVHVDPPFEVVQMYPLLAHAAKLDPLELEVTPVQALLFPVDVLHVHVDPPFVLV